MKKRFLRTIAFILAITLTLPFAVCATAQDEKATSDGTDIVYELTELRNEFEKHFLMSDGTVTAAVYADPVNYYDKSDASWKEIDNTLTKTDGRYRNKGHGGFEVSFRADSSEGDLVEITSDGHTLSWSLSVENVSKVKDTLKTSLSATVKTQESRIAEEKLSASKAYSGIRYNSPFTGNKIINVDYTVSQYKVKEDITIYSAKDGNVLYYTYNCGNLTAVLNDDNSIEFIDSTGETVYTVSRPYMYDSAGNGSYGFDMTLRQLGNACAVVVVPDKTWLDTAVYPVVIDPIVTNNKATSNYSDTYIHQGDNPGDHKDETTMNIGMKGGVQNYALIKIGSFPTIPANAELLKAELQLSLPAGSTSGGPFTAKFIATSWNENTVCFNNKPSVGIVIDENVAGDFGKKTITFDIESYYTKVIKGTIYNYGIWIENSLTTLNDFNSPYTSECGDTTKYPTVIITYSVEQESENNNSTSTSDFIDMTADPYIPASVQGIIGSSLDVDYYKITPPRHGRIEIQISAVQCNHKVTILNSSGEVVFGPVQTNKASLNGNQVIKHTDFTFLTSKTAPLTSYYVKVEGVGSDTFNDYYISVRYTTAYSAMNWEYPMEPFRQGSSNYNIYATSPVGARDGGYHNALDLSANIGEELFAVTDAYVAKSSYHYSNTGMGNYVVLWTGAVNGEDITRAASEVDPYTNEPFAIVYMHMSSRAVAEGDVVSKGDTIGYAGNSGGPDYGSHLHLEIYVVDTMPKGTEYNYHANTTAPSIESIINPYSFYCDQIRFTGYPY